jgi:hypothetical protein
LLKHVDSFRSLPSLAVHCRVAKRISSTRFASHIDAVIRHAPSGHVCLRPEAETMSASENVSFGAYELICGARAADQGVFAPTLTVARRAWPSRPRVIAMARGTYATEASAIESARAQGVQWVKDFG